MSTGKFTCNAEELPYNRLASNTQGGAGLEYTLVASYYRNHHSHINFTHSCSNVPVLWEFTFVHYYSTYINKKRKPSIHLHNLQGHNLVVGMGSDFDLHELLKPHLSPALPHWKRTRVSGGQLDHNLKIC